MAKGIAILWVLLIHSDALHGNLLFRQIVNQAVPVFLVLFGLNSSSWWRQRDLRRDLGAWYGRALRRIMVPAWAAVAVWWCLALYFHPFGVPLRWWLPIAHALGYLLHVGTGWFITMIIQLVAVFPLLELVRRRYGLGVLLVFGFATTAAITQVALWMADTWGLFNYWIFSPRFFANVTFGMALAHYRERVTPGTGVLAAVVLAICVASDVLPVPLWFQQQAFWIGALALAVVLLTGLRGLAAVPVVATALVWLGQSSYGVYLGQLMTHNLFVYYYGLGELYVRLNLWLYTAILLAGGLASVWVGERLLRSGPSPQKALDTPQGGGGS
jgi:peptidoglycan/LPS O-acetylase OafA/YrhL